MKDSKKREPAARTAVQLRLSWNTTPDDMPQVNADEVAVSYIGDRIYLTFGALIPPQPSSAGTPATELRIKPVARVVLSEQGLKKFRGLLAAMDSPTVDEPKEAE